MIGIVGFAASSGLCGATPKGSWAETWIIVFRVLQGVSGALMIPAALAIVVAAFPLHERGRALAIFFGVSGGLTAIGPIAGGILTQWTWRSIFWINIPVAIVALVLTVMAKIPLDQPAPRPIDWRGAALVALGMGLSVLGLRAGPDLGLEQPGDLAVHRRRTRRAGGVRPASRPRTVSPADPDQHLPRAGRSSSTTPCSSSP